MAFKARLLTGLLIFVTIMAAGAAGTVQAARPTTGSLRPAVQSTPKPEDLVVSAAPRLKEISAAPIPARRPKPLIANPTARPVKVFTPGQTVAPIKSPDQSPVTIPPVKTAETVAPA
jgi:hypothetical protein